MKHFDDSELIEQLTRLQTIRADAAWKEKAWQEISAKIQPFWRMGQRAPWKKLVFATSLVLVILLAGSGALVASAQETLPGDTLYPVKRQGEKFRVLTTRDPAQRAKLEATYGNRRLKEYERLIIKEDGQDRLTKNQQQAAAGIDEATVKLEGQLPRLTTREELDEYIKVVEMNQREVEGLKSRTQGVKRQRLDQTAERLRQTLDKAQRAYRSP